MKVPSGYYKVYIVHVGPQIREMFTEPGEAVKAVRKLVESGEPGEFQEGLQEFTQKCYDRGRGSKIRLTMVEAHREVEKLNLWLEAWEKGMRRS